MILEGAELDLEEGDFQSGEGDDEEDTEDVARMHMVHQQQLQYAQAHAQRTGEGPPSSFAHNITIPPPRSSHSSGSSHSWHDDQIAPPHIPHVMIDTPPYMDTRSRSRSHSYSQPRREQRSSPQTPSSSGSFQDGSYDHSRQQPQHPHRMFQDDSGKWMYAHEAPQPQMSDVQRQFIHHPSTY